MKTFATFAAAAAFLCAPLSTSLAVDIINDDEAPYEVLITDDSDILTVLVESGGTVVDVCKSCTVEIDGADAVVAEDVDVVRIRDGILIVE